MASKTALKMVLKMRSVLCVVIILTVLPFGLCSCRNRRGELLFAGVSDSPIGVSPPKEEIDVFSNSVVDDTLAGTSRTVTINGKTYTGYYDKSLKSPYRRGDWDEYLCTENGRHILTFFVNRYSQKVIEYSLRGVSCETTMENGKSRDECREIALQTLREHYKDAVFKEIEVQDYANDKYNFMFVKMIGDLETTAGVTIRVNTDGKVVSFNATTMPAFENQGLAAKRFDNIDESDLDVKIDNKLSEILQGREYEKWEIKSRKLAVMKYAGPCVIYEISLYLDKKEERISADASVMFVMPL